MEGSLKRKKIPDSMASAREWSWLEAQLKKNDRNSPNQWEFK